MRTRVEMLSTQQSLSLPLCRLPSRLLYLQNIEYSKSAHYWSSHQQLDKFSEISTLCKWTSSCISVSVRERVEYMRIFFHNMAKCLFRIVTSTRSLFIFSYSNFTSIVLLRREKFLTTVNVYHKNHYYFLFLFTFLINKYF